MLPLLPLAIALSAGSVLANQYGQNKINKARGTALQADAAQRALQEKRAAVAADTTLETLASTGAREAGRAKEIAAKAKANQAPTAPGSAPTVPLTEVGTSPQLIETMRTDRAGTRGFANNQADQNAVLAAFGDIMLGNQIAAGRNAQDIRQAGTAANNYTNNVLPLQLNSANAAGQQYFTLADLMGLGASFAWPAALAKPGMAGEASLYAKGKKAADYFDVSTLRPPVGRVV